MCPLHKQKNEPFVDTTATKPKDATFYPQSSLKASDIKRLPSIPRSRILLPYVWETKCERYTLAMALFDLCQTSIRIVRHPALDDIPRVLSIEKSQAYAGLN